VDKVQQCALAGAVGMVLANDDLSGNEIIADTHVLPASEINYTNGLAVYEYIKSTRSGNLPRSLPSYVRCPILGLTVSLRSSVTYSIIRLYT